MLWRKLVDMQCPLYALKKRETLSSVLLISRGSLMVLKLGVRMTLLSNLVWFSPRASLQQQNAWKYSDYLEMTLLQFGQRFWNSSLLMTFPQSECQFWRRKKHIYVYHGNNILTDNTVSLFISVYTATNWLWCKIWRWNSAWKAWVSVWIYDTFLVEPLATNPMQFCSINKLSTPMLAFLVFKMVHLLNRNKIIFHLVNTPELHSFLWNIGKFISPSILPKWYRLTVTFFTSQSLQKCNFIVFWNLCARYILKKSFVGTGHLPVIEGLFFC